MEPAASMILRGRVSDGPGEQEVGVVSIAGRPRDQRKTGATSGNATNDVTWRYR
jgi:hypothetical protein